MLKNNEINRIYSQIATNHNVEGYCYSISNENNNNLNLQMEEHAAQGVKHHCLQQIQLGIDLDALAVVEPSPEVLPQAIPNLGIIQQDVPELALAEVGQWPI